MQPYCIVLNLVIGSSGPSGTSVAVLNTQMETEECQSASAEIGVSDGQVMLSKRNSGKIQHTEWVVLHV